MPLGHRLRVINYLIQILVKKPHLLLFLRPYMFRPQTLELINIYKISLCQKTYLK